MIPHSFLQILLDRVDIVSLIDHFVELKKKGANLIGLCPFHNEKSPSFTVSPTKKFYHCFGCGAHGTAISFLVEYKGLPFLEAVNELAKLVRLTVPHESSSLSLKDDRYVKHISVSTSVSPTLSDIMQDVCNYYRKQLRITPYAIKYLKNRGLNGEVAARFNLGYSPSGWHNLKSAFQDYYENILIELGLVVVNETINSQNSSLNYDRFRERIIFPIRNIKGQVVGFGGRILDAREPKYINSPETPIFSKSNELYGLFEGRFSIRERKFVIVVEGYMDVLMLVQFGFPNVVATLGTTCTSVQVKKLFQQTDTIIFSFDGDVAGRRAARRALDACLPLASDDKTIRFISLPSEYDPDSYLHKFGCNAFAEQIERAIPLSQFILNEVITGKVLDQPEGKAKALFDARPMLKALPENMLRAQIIHLISDRLDISLDEIAYDIGTWKVFPKRSTKIFNNQPLVTDLEKRTLKNLIMYPRIVMQLDSDERIILCTLTRYSELFCEVINHARSFSNLAEFRLLSDMLRISAKKETYEKIFQEIFLYDENIRDLLQQNKSDNSIIKQQHDQEFIVTKEVKVAVLKIRYNICNSRLDQLTKQLKHTPDEFKELMELNKKRTDMKHQLSL